jgi:hypothetical protein
MTLRAAVMIAQASLHGREGIPHGDVGIFVSVVVTGIPTDRDLGLGQHDVDGDPKQSPFLVVPVRRIDNDVAAADLRAELG